MTTTSPEQEELRAQLQAKEASLNARLDTLQYEVAQPFKALPFVGGGGGAPSPLMEKVRANPLAVAVGTVALAALASFVLGMRKKRKRRPAPDDQKQLVQAYLQTVLDDASARMARGRTAEEAIDQAFRRRPPIILYGDTEASVVPKSKASFLREGARAVGNQAFRVGLSYAAGRLQAQD